MNYKDNTLIDNLELSNINIHQDLKIKQNLKLTNFSSNQSQNTITILLEQYINSQHNIQILKSIINQINYIKDSEFKLFPELNIIPILINGYINGKRIEQKLSIKLLLLLTEKSSEIAEEIDKNFDFFANIKETQYGIEVLKILTYFLQYCGDNTGKVLENDLLSYLLNETIENNENDELFECSLDFMIALIETQNLFNENYEKKWLNIFSICSDICSFLFLKKNNNNLKARKLRALILQNLAVMDNVNHFENVFTPTVELGFCETIGKGDEIFMENLEVLNVLIDHNQQFIFDFLANSSILSSLVRLLSREDLFIPIINFLTRFADISVESSALLVDFGLLEIFIQEESKYQIKTEDANNEEEENKDQVSAYLETTLSIFNFNEEKKKATIKLFIMFCITLPKKMIEDENVKIFLEIAYDSLPLYDENFCLLYTIAIRNLLDNGMSEDYLHDPQEVAEWFEECVSNSLNDEIVEISQYILDHYFT